MPIKRLLLKGYSGSFAANKTDFVPFCYSNYTKLLYLSPHTFFTKKGGKEYFLLAVMILLGRPTKGIRIVGLGGFFRV